METKIPLMPLYASSEYMLVLSPDEHLQERIGRVRQALAEKAGVSGATKASAGSSARNALFPGSSARSAVPVPSSSARTATRKSHILLARWDAWDMQEERILQRLHILSMEQYPFKVHLEDFGGFPSHTIYIPVTSREPILRLVGQLRQHKRLMQSAAGNPYFISEPYLPLARGLSSGQYEQAMQFLGHKHFQGNFIASAMLLLKKRAGSSGYQILKRFEFEHLAVTARQTSLFA